LVRASLAELELARGNTATALDELELAGAHVEETGERYYLAEILRLRAECLLASADTDDSREAAARLLETAIAIADAQGAALWTQRASASLDRLKERRTP
jgi:predicted ATPase